MKPTWTQLQISCGPALSRVVASYAPPGADRDDLAQEVSAALVQALHRFRGDASLKTFALRVAHNVCLRHSLRRRKWQLDSDVELVDPRASPESTAAQRQRENHLLVAIRQLPVGLRQVLALALEDLSHREIGEVLGISENAVGIRMHRARAALKTQLEAS